MEELHRIAAGLGSIVWGPLMIFYILGTGIYLTIRLRLIQFRGFRHALELVSGRYDSHEDEGDISHFQALSAALSATIGTGNIAGVATAIAAGGPGALFWMWISAFVGMATKYTSCTLSLKFRKILPDGSVSGGPMYYLEKGVGNRTLAILFALFTVIASFGIGNMVQANSIAEPLSDLMQIPKWMTGSVLAILTAMVILGGIKRIGYVASRVVPFMSIVYVGGALLVLLLHLDRLLPTFQVILREAFKPTAAVGGFAGATVMETMRFGIARGVFSNEAGLGSAPIAHAAAKTKEPVREGLVALLEPFIDTIVICTMTGLVIVQSGLWTQTDGLGHQLTGATLSARAFAEGLPGLGQYVVAVGIVFFAFSTILGWSYYGDRAVEYLFGSRFVRYYHWLWVFLVPVGAMSRLDTIWSLSDVANAFMAVPNVLALILLSGFVSRQTEDYFKRKSDGAFQ